jgi:hypothetical protein
MVVEDREDPKFKVGGQVEFTFIGGEVGSGTIETVIYSNSLKQYCYKIDNMEFLESELLWSI